MRSTWWPDQRPPVVGYGRQTPDSLENRREDYDHQARGADDQLRFTVYDLTGGTPTPVGTAAV